MPVFPAFVVSDKENTMITDDSASVTLPLFQIDAFTQERFHGNPAAVCPLSEWLDDDVMQNIAAENNLAETAFLVPKTDTSTSDYELRWFTPKVEVNLCGHATLASAYWYFTYMDTEARQVRFTTRGGVLTATRQGERIALSMPATETVEYDTADELVEAIGLKDSPTTVQASYHAGEDLMLLLDSEESVRNCQPDFSLLAEFPARGIIITAKGEQADFVCRFFAPACGINEDPVTGSAFCALMPYWSQILNAPVLHGQQISSRGGDVYCFWPGKNRVMLSGHCVEYLSGQIRV